MLARLLESGHTMLPEGWSGVFLEDGLAVPVKSKKLCTFSHSTFTSRNLFQGYDEVDAQRYVCKDFTTALLILKIFVSFYVA